MKNPILINEPKKFDFLIYNKVSNNQNKCVFIVILGALEDMGRLEIHLGALGRVNIRFRHLSKASNWLLLFQTEKWEKAITLFLFNPRISS